MLFVVVGGGERRRGTTYQPTTMTADDVTEDRLRSLWALLDAARTSVDDLLWQNLCGTMDPAEAAAIVNETIQNLTNEAR